MLSFPLGPMSPALALPVALTLRLRGERVAEVAPPVVGFCHRGWAQQIDGRLLSDASAFDAALDAIERSCSLAGAAHRRAFCRAVETARGLQVSRRDARIRALFVEMERLSHHLWVLGMVSRAAGHTDLFQAALEQRETLFDALETATGARCYGAVATLGGVRGDLAPESLRGLLEGFATTATSWQMLTGARGALGRVGVGVGVISAEQVATLGLSGLPARGSQAPTGDTPQRAQDEVADDDTPTATLDTPAPSEAMRAGDVVARTALIAAEFGESRSLALAILDALEVADDGEAVGAGSAVGAAPDEAWYTPSGRSARVTINGPHGAAKLSLRDATDGLHDLQLETPTTATLAALPELLAGQQIAVVPLILASLDLCLECHDR